MSKMRRQTKVDNEITKPTQTQFSDNQIVNLSALYNRLILFRKLLQLSFTKIERRKAKHLNHKDNECLAT